MSLFGWLERLLGSGGDTDSDTSETHTTTVDESRAGKPSADETDRTEGNGPPTADAEALVEQAAEAGYDLDFSPESLTALDSLADDLTAEGREQFGRPIVAYLGEVFVENYDGEWTVVDEIGWLVDLSGATDRDEENLFAIPQATQAVLEGDETFAGVHDQTVAGLDVSAPTLSDGSPATSRNSAGTPLNEAARGEYREQAEELVETWTEYDLDYSPASLASVDELIADNYDMTPEDVTREERLSEAPPGVVPEGANVTIGSGAATTQIAAYVGEVFGRTYDAEWYEGAFDTVVVETADQTIEFEPEHMVNVAYHGWISFEELHDALVTEQGLAVDR